MTLTPRIVRIPDITEDDLITLWVGTEENMRLRGSARHSMQAGPFSPTPTVEGELPTGGRGGSISRMAPSEEVMRDREESARRGGNGSLPSPEVFEPEQAVVEAPPPDAGAAQPQGAVPSIEGGDVDPAGGAAVVERPADDAMEQQVEPEADAEAEPEPQEEPVEEPPPGRADVSLYVEPSSARVGDSLVVAVNIANAQNVASVPFRLRYNPQVVEYVAGHRGSFLQGAGQEPVFLATGEGGEVVVGLSRIGGGEGASGSGELARFEFRAIGAGDARFTFSGASVKDPQARNLLASFAPAQVHVVAQ
jgi:hypothetical protein